MIEEQYVSFDTAKMLKEAGFDVPCFNQYTERGTIWHCDCPENFNKSQCVTSCPTQSLAARWLREVHRIFIEDYILINGTFSYSIFIGGRNQLECERHDIYQSYEDCVEHALQEAIKLIKK